ncbi:hypothetical protein LEP1GSC043_3711 [Leptospira weilii str. Ecochallenge]|uniref:Uncharacterized protein n=2 Tax=Leptospira weilii TaxID=28184 RepID=N1UCV9_9LEPT|nr:hypothetical protein LEP1GSC043_3711 [Leptospira weilii str. Ecochallenge]
MVNSKNLKRNYIHSSPPKSYQPDQMNNFYTMEMRKKLSDLNPESFTPKDH